MGNYRQHLAFGTIFGVVYSVSSVFFAGLHWAYATVALLLSMLGGLLPDIDSASGVEMKGFTGILGVLASLVVWRKMSSLEEPPGFEYHLWAIVLSYVAVRHGLRRLMVHIAVHRGMCHSIPTGALWGAITYLSYPSDHHAIRVAMAFAVMLGFLSHLLLDEMCSVDLQGARVNKAFGTALKFWAPSTLSTIMVYAALSLLSWKIVHNWPEEEEGKPILGFQAPAPDWPYPWPQSWLQDGFKDLRVYAQEQLNLMPGRIDQVKQYTAKEFDGLPEDLAKAKKYVSDNLPDAEKKLRDVSPEQFDAARKYVTKNLPGVEEKIRNVSPKQLDGARDFVERNLPKAESQVKKIANGRLPSPPRR